MKQAVNQVKAKMFAYVITQDVMNDPGAFDSYQLGRGRLEILRSYS